MVSLYIILYKGKVMTIELDDKTYIVGFWFAEMTTGHSNLTCFYKDDKDAELKGITRIRLKKDDKIFNSEDEKKWYDMKMTNPDYPLTEEEIIKRMAGAQKTFKLAG